MAKIPETEIGTNKKAVPIFGHRSWAKISQDKAEGAYDTAARIDLIVGANQFWNAKKSMGFTVAIEYVGDCILRGTPHFILKYLFFLLVHYFVIKICPHIR